MRCKKCGNEIKDGEKFCGKCGTKTSINEGVYINKEEKTNNKILIIIGIILLVIVGMGIISNIIVSNNAKYMGKNRDYYESIGAFDKFNKKNTKVERNWYYDDENNITDGEIILHIGDYINYDEQTNATQIQYISTAANNGYNNQSFVLSDYKYGWRVLGIENGQILITSEDIIGPSVGYVRENDEYGRIYYFINSFKGYYNAIQELNNICSLYGQGTGASKARSITVEDINKITGYKPNSSTGDYEYCPQTLKDTSSGEEIGIKSDSVEFDLLFINHKSNSSIIDKYKGKKLGCKYWLASTFQVSYFGGSVKEYGLRCIDSGYVNIVTLYTDTENSSSRLVGKNDAGVRPVVYLDKYVKLIETYEGSCIYNIEI